MGGVGGPVQPVNSETGVSLEPSRYELNLGSCASVRIGASPGLAQGWA